MNEQAKPTLLIVGDSLSSGHGIDRTQGWVALLEKRLQGDYQVMNASISGDTTDNGLKRLPKLLAQYKPVLTIIELGGNDGLRGFPLNSIETQLREMVKLAKTNGKTLLIGMHIPPNYGKRYTKGFYHIYTRLAEETGTPLVPFLLEGIGGNPDLMQQDGIHPNQRAQMRMLDNAWPQILQLLK